VRDGVLAGHRLVAVFDVVAGGADERAAMPIWASLAVFYRDMGPDGLPAPPTAAQLDALNARLCTLLAACGRGRLVGTITINGRRELVIYTAAAEELRRAARALQDQFPELELQLTVMRDPDWTVFRQFVPEKR